MALKKVKGNIERMFDKNLTDLVRGIRNNKENEVFIKIKESEVMSEKLNFLGEIYIAMHGRHKIRAAPRQFIG